MNMIVPRTCTEISTDDATRRQDAAPRPLEDFRDVPAYVLLGDAGAGKSTAFEAEDVALGDDAFKVDARDILTFKPQDHPEWWDRTLYIDGLDEARAGTVNVLTPFDKIRRRLDTLRRPRFRLSCREADWLGVSDRARLESVSPNGKITILRLNPLTNENITELLQSHLGADNAEAFIDEANHRRIGGLLRNPETLELLTKAVAGGGGHWPANRTETFEMACKQMVCERNKQHVTARAPGYSPGPDQLLDAAGRICAVQLIVGVAGYTRPHGQSDPDHPALASISDDRYPTRLLNAASATRLFTEADSRFSPVHRQISEFLGARYLAQLVSGGLPVRRVIALMTGGDGTVVTELRGLSSWLAAHCKAARADLIERDPAGLALYGDIGEFSLDEKIELLESLKRHPSRLDSVWTYSDFTPLVTRDMQPTLKKVLEDKSRDQGHETFTGFILRVLAHGVRMPTLSQDLLEIVRDDTRKPGINRVALDAFLHNCTEGQERADKLKALLDDVLRGDLFDPDSKILGTLLSQLYPDEITPIKIWDYLSEKKDRERPYIGEYEFFWHTGLIEKSSDEQVTELLDHFPHRHPGLRSHSLQELPLKLLMRGLRSYGDQLGTARLYDWLGVGEIEEGHWERGKAAMEIRSWLEERPELQKALVLEGLDRWCKSSDLTLHTFYIHDRLYGANLPRGFSFWCMEQAIGSVNTKPEVAAYLFEEAFRRRKKDGLTLDVLRRQAQKHRTLQVRLDALLTRTSRIQEQEQKHREQSETFTEKQRQREKEWLEYARGNMTALRENSASPALLHRLAEEYFEAPEDALRQAPQDRLLAIPHDSRRSELQRLRSEGAGLNALKALLGKDLQLVEAAVRGLMGTIHRQDVPDVKEILDLRAQNQMHYLGWPFLAALEENERTAPEDELPQWNEAVIRKALAFYHCFPPPTDDPPEWYRRLLKACPETLADVQVQFTIRELRRGREHVFRLAKLADDPAHAQVAHHASLPMLRAFPTRCKLKQLESLQDMLWSAIQYADGASLRELIEKKLSRGSMNDTQRVLWLAAGFVIAPETYQHSLRQFVQGHERRSRNLAEFFWQRGPRVPLSWLEGKGILGSEELVRILGSYAGPELRSPQGWFTPSVRASQLVDRLIQQNLAASPDQAASRALNSLIEDPTLGAWRDVLIQAQEAQQVVRRDADFRHPTIEQVCQSLNGGKPANAGELAALVVDRLRELAQVIRRGNTNAWRDYWNVDSNGRPSYPRPENTCRNTLLTALEHRLLPQGLDAQREVQLANDNRADICVSCEGFRLPVEIKKNDNRELWSALRNQLIAKYASDLDAEGYGIYLVLWFGRKWTQLPPSCKQPESAAELEERITKEAKLSEIEQRKISVHVIDVSKP